MVSLQSQNLFDVLAGSGDEGEVSSGPAAAPPAAKNSSSSQAGKKAPAAQRPQEAAAEEGKKKENRPPRDGRPRNEYPPRGGRANKAVTLRPKDQEGAGAEADARPAARGPRNPRGEDGPQGHQRDKTDHRYGARGGYQGGRGRQFDRHSGGHRESERKASQGWGDPTENPDDVANQSGAAAAVSGAESDPWAALADPADKAAANTPAEDPEAAARAAELRRLREEEEKQKTLDEYLAEKATCSVALPEARKANEGADVTQWKDAVLLKNDDEQVLFAGKESTGKSRNRKERNKAVVDIKQQFAPRPRPERTTDNFGRRDRGQFRPNEGAGRGRGGDQRPSRPTGDRNLNVGDECAFPTLR